jgi:hypothetical protein
LVAQQPPRPSGPFVSGTVTLIEGAAFSVCTPSGDILPGGTDGVFFRDTRQVVAQRVGAVSAASLRAWVEEVLWN